MHSIGARITSETEEKERDWRKFCSGPLKILEKNLKLGVFLSNVMAQGIAKNGKLGPNDDYRKRENFES